MDRFNKGYVNKPVFYNNIHFLSCRMGHAPKGVSFLLCAPICKCGMCFSINGFQHSDLIGIEFYGDEPVNCGTVHILGILLMNS